MLKRIFVVALMGIAVTLTYSLNAAEETAKKPAAKKPAAKCPVSGKVCKKEFAVAHNGGQVFFCCPNCPKAFAANTAKFAAKANHQLVLTGQAKEVKCPIAGRKLNPKTAIDVAGVKVAFCCNNCKGKAVKAEGNAQIELIFNDKSFAKAFEVAKKEKK